MWLPDYLFKFIVLPLFIFYVFIKCNFIYVRVVVNNVTKPNFFHYVRHLQHLNHKNVITCDFLITCLNSLFYHCLFSMYSLNVISFMFVLWVTELLNSVYFITLNFIHMCRVLTCSNLTFLRWFKMLCSFSYLSFQ
jgi:hypothetical protein